MKQIKLDFPAHCEVELPEISGSFAQQNSDDQSIILMDMFDALEHKCKTEFDYEKQLHFISVSINRYNFKRLKYTIETLNEFLKDSE